MATAKPAYEKRPYQEACLRALKSAFRGGAKLALFVLATGLGKTFVAVQFLRWLLRQVAGETEGRPRVLVLCHQKPILRQLRKSFADLLGDGYTYGLYKPGRKAAPPPEVDFLFATFQTMKRRKAQFGRGHFDVLLVDEGHHSMADSYAATLRYFEVRFRFAMTATPNRLDLRDIRQLFGPEVYAKPLVAALAEGLLPRVVYKYFVESRGRLASEALEGGRPSRERLDRTFFAGRGTPARDGKVADAIAAEMGKLAHPRALVFCQTIADCDRMTTYLVERGVRAAAVHSQVDDDEQENRLDALAGGQLEALVARDVLNEGKDIPAINLVAIVRSTGSRTVFEQQIGRGLRPGKEQLLVLDFVANCDRIQFLADTVAAVRKAVRTPGGCDTVEEPDDEDVPVSVLDEDMTGLPFGVVPGGPEFEVVFRDLLQVLGRTGDWTVESGRAALLALARRLGKDTLTSGDVRGGSAAGVCPSAPWACKHLAPETGRMAEVVASLGLTTPPASRTDWTVESGKAALRALAERLGRQTLTSTEVREGSRKRECPSPPWVLDHLAPKTHRWKEALRAIGLEPSPRTAESGGEALRALARKLGQATLSQPDIQAGSKAGDCPGWNWIRRTLAPRTGRLAEVLETAGLEPTRWTVKTAGEALRRLAADLGRKTLSYPDVREASRSDRCPKYGWIMEHLAGEARTLAGALKAIGLSAD
jgi:superfamily II DNA or RNA helicase